MSYLAVTDAMTGINTAVKAADGAPRVYEDPGAVVDPPGFVLGPPTLTWEGYQAEPTGCTFTAALVARADDRALGRLMTLLPVVVSAVESFADAVVLTATPGTFAISTGGGSELPAYLLQIEVSL